MFGELHLDGFEVSHTKDGFRWEEGEDAFLDLLKEHLDRQPLPLLEQAEDLRVRPKSEDLRDGAEVAVSSAAEVMARDVPSVVASLEESTLQGEEAVSLPSCPLLSSREVEIRHHDECWQVKLSLTDDPAIGEWLEISNRTLDPSRSGGATRQLEVRLSLLHPFMERFGGIDAAQIEPLLRVAIAFALGEVIAYDSSVRNARAVRDNANELLRQALANP